MPAEASVANWHRQYTPGADHRFRHHEAAFPRTELQPDLRRRRGPPAEGRLRLPARGQRRGLRVSWRVCGPVLGPHVHQQRPRRRRGHRHVRLLFSHQPRHLRAGRRQHPLLIRAGCLERHDAPDPQSRGAVPSRRRFHRFSRVSMRLHSPLGRSLLLAWGPPTTFAPMAG